VLELGIYSLAQEGKMKVYVFAIVLLPSWMDLRPYIVDVEGLLRYLFRFEKWLIFEY
jgi:hypothetical protein